MNRFPRNYVRRVASGVRIVLVFQTAEDYFKRNCIVLIKNPLRHSAQQRWVVRDKTLLFRKKNIVESALYVKKKWTTIYSAIGMWYGKKSCEWLQKKGSR